MCNRGLHRSSRPLRSSSPARPHMVDACLAAPATRTSADVCAPRSLSIRIAARIRCRAFTPSSRRCVVPACARSDRAPGPVLRTGWRNDLARVAHHCARVSDVGRRAHDFATHRLGHDVRKAFHSAGTGAEDIERGHQRGHVGASGQAATDAVRKIELVDQIPRVRLAESMPLPASTMRTASLPRATVAAACRKPAWSFDGWKRATWPITTCCGPRPAPGAAIRGQRNRSGTHPDGSRSE